MKRDGSGERRATSDADRGSVKCEAAKNEIRATRYQIRATKHERRATKFSCVPAAGGVDCGVLSNPVRMVFAGRKGVSKESEVFFHFSVDKG